MKKFSVVWAFMLVLFLIRGIEAGQIQLRIPDTTVVAGSEFLLPVYADSSLTGGSVMSYQFRLQCNATYLEVKSAEFAGTLTSTAGMSGSYKVSGDMVNIAAAGANAMAGKGVLFYIKLRAKSPVNYLSIQFSGGAVNNYFNEGSPAIIFKTNYLHIQSVPYITVYPDNALLAPGEKTSFYVSNATLPVTWHVTNNAVASISESGVLTALAGGLTKVYAIDNAGVRDTINGVVDIRAVKLSVPDTSNYANTVADIPVYINNVSSLGIVSGSLSIGYNASVLNASDVITSGTLLSGASKPQFSISDGKINIAFAATSPLTGGGILIYVRFVSTKTRTGSSNITLSDAVFNENIIPKYDNGSFTKRVVSDMYLTPNNGILFSGDNMQLTVTGGLPPYKYSVTDTVLGAVDAGGKLYAKKGGILRVTVQDSTGFAITSGNFNIYDVRVSLRDTSAVNGDTLGLPVYYDPVNSSGRLYAFETLITFDKNKILPVGAYNSGTLSNSWQIAANSISEGSVKIAAAGTSAIANKGILFIYKFKLLSDQNSSVRLESLLLNEGWPLAYTSNSILYPVAIMAPGQLTAVLTVNNQVRLTWMDNSNNEDGFIIERRAENEYSFIRIDTVSSGIRAFIDMTTKYGTRYYYRVAAYKSNIISQYSNIAEVLMPVSVNSEKNIPAGFELMQNYPNPFNPSTIISFSIPDAAHVTLKVYDIMGNEIATLADGIMKSGRHSIELRAQDYQMSSGVYIYRLIAGGNSNARRMVLLK